MITCFNQWGIDMSDSRNKTEELEKLEELKKLEELYDLKEELTDQNNEFVQRSRTLYLELNALKLKPTPGNAIKIQSCTNEKAIVDSQFNESKVEDKLKDTLEKIKVLETKVLGQPLSDSPHPRNRPGRN